MTALLGYHEVINYQLPLEHVARMQPAHHVVVGGISKPQDGMNRARNIKAVSPKTIVTLRLHDDDKTMERLGPEEWIRIWGPFLAKDGAWSLGIDNEPNDNPGQQAKWEAEVIDWAARQGGSVTYGRWSEGNPTNHDVGYGQFVAAHREAAYAMGVHGIPMYFGPNAYFDPSNPEERKWIAFRQQYFTFLACDRAGIQRPREMFISEFGLRGGWKNAGLTASEYVNELIDWSTIPPPAEEVPGVDPDDLIVPRTIFAVGSDSNHEALNVHDGAFYQNLELNNPEYVPATPPPTEPPVEPPTEPPAPPTSGVWLAEDARNLGILHKQLMETYFEIAERGDR